MNWFSSKRSSNPQPESRSTVVTVESIRRKLSGYQATEGKARFTGPSLAQMQNWFEYEQVKIDPESSGYHRVPFHC